MAIMRGKGLIVCIIIHLDTAPVLSERIHGKVSSSQKHFFFNKPELRAYHCATNLEKKKDLPGAAYIDKIMAFQAAHYCVGELFMEYLKGSCHDGNEVCAFCAECGWVGPQMSYSPTYAR